MLNKRGFFNRESGQLFFIVIYPITNKNSNKYDKKVNVN